MNSGLKRRKSGSAPRSPGFWPSHSYGGVVFPTLTLRPYDCVSSFATNRGVKFNSATRIPAN